MRPDKIKQAASRKYNRGKPGNTAGQSRPAAVDEGNGQTFARREVTSNEFRYQNDESSGSEDQDTKELLDLIANTQRNTLSSPSQYFQFSSEKQSIDLKNDILQIDSVALHALFAKLPLHERLGLAAEEVEDYINLPSPSKDYFTTVQQGKSSKLDFKIKDSNADLVQITPIGESKSVKRHVADQSANIKPAIIKPKIVSIVRNADEDWLDNVLG